MARFSTKKKTAPQVKNRAGGSSYKQSTKLELASLLLTSFAQDQFYRSADATFKELEQLIGGLDDKKYVANALLYARNVFGMRSITHAGTAFLLNQVKGQDWTKSFVDQVVRIPKDATEILAFYMSTFGKPLPNALKRGIAQSLTRFSEYQLSKNKGEGNDLSLVDAVNLCHPKYTPALNKLMKGELKQTNTWESQLSATQGNAKEKEGVWKTLLSEKKLGYVALLRNLRNIEQQSPKSISLAVEQLTDIEHVQKSLVFPFQFQTALEHVTDRKLIEGLNKAIDISLSNVPKLEGKILIALDDSGSMTQEKENVSHIPSDTGSLFASVLYKTNDADLIMFNDRARYETLNPSDTVSTLTQKIRSKFQSAGTDFEPIFQTANKAYDRIIILSDMQAWVSGRVPAKAFNAYCKKFNCSPKIYSFDLAGYGTMQFPEKNVFCLAGFSDKIFDVMKLLDEDKEALVHKIETYKLTRSKPKEEDEEFHFTKPLFEM